MQVQTFSFWLSHVAFRRWTVFPNDVIGLLISASAFARTVTKLIILATHVCLLLRL